MLRPVPLSTQVYNHLFPFPQKGVDPASWQEHVKRNLVPEIRFEVHQFYGNDSRSLEGKYPGLDYSSDYHRMRLRRYTYHRRLFRTMDYLGLTRWEIYNLCDWEGTLLVKGRFEQQNNVVLKDTTGDEVEVAVARRSQPRANQLVGEDRSDGGLELEEGVEHGKEEELGEQNESRVEGEGDEEAYGNDELSEETPTGTRFGSPDAVQDMTVSVMQQARLRMLNHGRGSTTSTTRAAPPAAA